MSILALLSGPAKGIIDGIGGIIDSLTTTDEERNDAKLAVAKLIHAENTEMEKTIRKELEAKERILVAELNQSDNYTKRARPTIVYTGLALAIGGAIAKILGSEIPVANLVPSEFWYAWAGVSGTWVISRGVEKVKQTATPRPSVFD